MLCLYVLFVCHQYLNSCPHSDPTSNGHVGDVGVQARGQLASAPEPTGHYSYLLSFRHGWSAGITLKQNQTSRLFTETKVALHGLASIFMDKK